MVRARPYRVAFNDSSDDDQNSHVMEVVPVIEESLSSSRVTSGTGDQPLERQRTKEQPSSVSWGRRLVGGVTTFLTSALVGPPKTDANAPFADEPHTTSTSGSSNWGYKGSINMAGHAEVLSRGGSMDLSEDIAVDLREVILQYQRTPDEVYMRIILAALYFVEVQIDGDVFSAASGNRDLIRTLLESGKVNVDDPVVQQVIQEEINSVMVPDPAYGGRINPDNIGYLAVLCRVPSATITRMQVCFCQQAGFEFAKILHDNPHVMRNLQPPRWVVARTLDICFVLDMALTWMGLIATLLNLACVAWITYHWFSIDFPNGAHWTILCYVVGYVVSIVMVMTSEEGRMRHYEDRIWNYPNNTLQIIPCIPVFEICLMYVTLRYESLRDKMKYFIIRYDLYNGLSNVLVIHAFFFATPQLLVQYYLCALYRPSIASFSGYKLLVFVCHTLYGISMYFLIRKAMFNFSCNSFGFAVMAAKRTPRTPVDIPIRILIVMTAFYLQGNVASIIFSLLRISKCGWDTIVLISTAGTMTVLEIIGLVLVLVFGVPRLVWFVCVPAITLQVVVSIYIAAVKKFDRCAMVTLFSIVIPIVPPIIYVMFGLLCLSFLACVGLLLYARRTGRRIGPKWGYYYYYLRGR